MEEEQYRLPPNLLFKSFAIVAGGYLFTMLTWLATTALLAYLFFPECAELLATPDLSPEQLFADPELALPTGLVLILLAIHSITCVFVGWFVSRISPFAKFNHAIFLAVAIFITFIQNTLNAPSELQWKFIAMMGVFPIAILFGAKIYAAQIPNQPELNQEQDS